MFRYTTPIKTILVAAIVLFSNCASHTKTAYKKLVWADEFDNDGLPDSSKWSYDKGNGCPDVCGWGNNELQYYTTERPENARVQDGKLIIEARKEDFSGSKYTSARLLSKIKAIGNMDALK